YTRSNFQTSTSQPQPNNQTTTPKTNHQKPSKCVPPLLSLSSLPPPWPRPAALPLPPTAPASPTPVLPPPPLPAVPTPCPRTSSSVSVLLPSSLPASKQLQLFFIRNLSLSSLII
ncbi:uncharacterized protein TRIREDRAFT_121605, partial [Trichoderma reesei QM6a]